MTEYYDYYEPPCDEPADSVEWAKSERVYGPKVQLTSAIEDVPGECDELTADEKEASIRAHDEEQIKRAIAILIEEGKDIFTDW